MNPIIAAATEAPPEVAKLLTILAGGVALLLFLILKLRLQAFLALLVASIAVAAASGLPLAGIGPTIVDGMGKSLGFIAAVIGIGAIFGQVLEHSGGAQTLAVSLTKFFGEKRASWAMLVTGFIVSIPIFLDVALVILAPILYALARDTKKSVLVFGLPLLAGMAVTHAFVPPTPGPVWVAYELGVPLGWVIFFGAIVGFPTAIIAGPILAPKLAGRVKVTLPELLEAAPKKEGSPGGKPLPLFSTIMLLVGLPIALIVASTVIEQVYASALPQGLGKAELSDALGIALAAANPAVGIIRFLGHPVIALLLATLLALYVLGTRRGTTREDLMELSTKALGPAGIIILITGAGGVFKQVLISTGIADALKYQFEGSGIPVIALAWVFATLVRVAQGSATVAMVTAAGLMASLAADLSNPQLALIVVAIAAGATGFSHVNDSGFWIVSRYMGMTEKQTLQTWTLISIVISVVGFAIAFALWYVV